MWATIHSTTDVQDVRLIVPEYLLHKTNKSFILLFDGFVLLLFDAMKDPNANTTTNSNETFLKSFFDKLPWNTTFSESRANFRHRQEESLYRNEFRNLLRQNPNIFTSTHSDPSQYEAENAILKRVMNAERIAAASGFATFLVTFASIRYGPTQFITKFGSEARVKAFRDSQRKFQEKNNNFLGHSIEFVFGIIQASMAGWVGVRAYETVSTRQHSSLDQIAKIPLVPGRSALSDALCSEWVQTYRNIPVKFWNEPHPSQEWRAIRLFAIHCQQRMEYEKRLQLNKTALSSDNTVRSDDTNIDNHVSLPCAVDTVVKIEDVLSKEEMDLNGLGLDAAKVD